MHGGTDMALHLEGQGTPKAGSIPSKSVPGTSSKIYNMPTATDKGFPRKRKISSQKQSPQCRINCGNEMGQYQGRIDTAALVFGYSVPTRPHFGLWER